MSWLSSFQAPEVRASLVVFLFLSILGATLGLADDEGYYWALAQTPRWGFAYHPPGVAWSIALAQALLGWLPASLYTWILRLPNILFASALVAMAVRWVRQVYGERAGAVQVAVVVVSIPGLFALAWMAVPDWGALWASAVLFTATWEICFSARPRMRAFAAVAVGALVGVLFKLTGILACVSAALCLAIWAPRIWRRRALVALVVGVFVGGIPFVVWNAQNEWAALLYQVRDRHGGWAGMQSLLRFARYWGVQLLAGGVPLVAWTFWMLRTGLEPARRTQRFASLWVFLPLALFGLQPLWGESKVHWGFIAFWPALWVWAGAKGDEAWRQARRLQVIQAALLTAATIIALYTPLISRMGEIWDGHPPAPLVDIGNDLWGWERLQPWLSERGLRGVPVVASRYQTAGQAAFALRGFARVEQVPRSFRERDDWRSLGVADAFGPEWPKLLARVIYVADFRYSEEPQYKGARCERLGEIQVKRRWFSREYAGRWIRIWDCNPSK